MSKKFKGAIAMLFLSLSFFMMITTRYVHALGDYILKFIGLSPWTGEYSGTHLTVFYFGVLTIFGMILVRKHVIEDLKIRTGHTVLLFIALISVFTITTNGAARVVKANSEGLLSVGIYPKESKITYRSENRTYTDFNAEIKMENYGEERKEFYLTIDSPYYREEGVKPINFYNKDGKKAIFSLNGKERVSLKIDLSDYDVRGGRVSLNGSGTGTIQEVILTDLQGNAIRLDNNHFIGIELGR